MGGVELRGFWVGRVRLGRNQVTGQHVAIKVVEKMLVEADALTDQVKKEVGWGSVCEFVRASGIDLWLSG